MVFTVKCVYEFIATMIMILLGDGVCAGNTLKHSKGQNGGWVVITLAWGLAVMTGVLIAGPHSGAHLNPAVTLGLAIAGSFAWNEVFGYILAQMLGGFCGALLVYIYYRDHFKAHEGDVVGVFCTMPAIDHKVQNTLCEIIATFVLVFVILVMGSQDSVFPITGLIMAIGMSLGGTTGYALNPARDLGPRLVHQLTIRRDSGWSYSWVPVAGPLVGAAIAAGIFILL